jgi:hypothetical protein
MKRSEQEVAGAISREHPPGSVGAVRSWGEPDDDESCGRVAKARHRAAPIRLIAKRSSLLVRDLLTPRDQTGTQPARGNV